MLEGKIMLLTLYSTKFVKVMPLCRPSYDGVTNCPVPGHYTNATDAALGGRWCGCPATSVQRRQCHSTISHQSYRRIPEHYTGATRV